MNEWFNNILAQILGIYMTQLQNQISSKPNCTLLFLNFLALMELSPVYLLFWFARYEILWYHRFPSENCRQSAMCPYVISVRLHSIKILECIEILDLIPFIPAFKVIVTTKSTFLIDELDLHINKLPYCFQAIGILKLTENNFIREHGADVWRSSMGKEW